MTGSDGKITLGENGGGSGAVGLKKFQHRDANFRISENCYKTATSAIVRLRAELQNFVDSHEGFRTSLTPVAVSADAPESARRMATAAELAGVGPMAAVAGTIAQMAAEQAREFSPELPIIIENGGDLFIYSDDELNIGLYAGDSPLSDKLALRVGNCGDGLAVCSSSSRMGHSLSLGDCDLATVVSKNASIADACATLAANLVKDASDVDAALSRIEKIPGVLGVIIIKADRIGLAGSPGEIVANRDSALISKVTKDPSISDGKKGAR